jgi:hypothetical protein
LTNFHKICIFHSESAGWRRKIFFIFRKEAWGQKEMFVKYSKLKQKDFAPEHLPIKTIKGDN